MPFTNRPDYEDMRLGGGSADILASISRGFHFKPICLSCRRRLYASAAAAEAPSTPASEAHPQPIPTENHAPLLRPTYALHAGLLLSRPPLLTRELHPFEKAYFLYQRRLNERLALPFTRYFYFKKGTPADVEWKRKVKERITAARDIGKYNAYGEEAWNDELVVGAKESEPSWQVEMLVRDAEGLGIGEGPDVATGVEDGGGGGEENRKDMGIFQGAEQIMRKEQVERPLSRITEADRSGDLRSLNRLLHRTLHLVVKREGRAWEFPSARLQHKETLHQAAERLLIQAAGPNMNTWVVGNAPVGHFVSDFPKGLQNQEKGSVELGEKTFFMKTRIMGGQANLAENKLGLSDFRWLAKEEIHELVTDKYWSMTQDMLPER